jgi:hypothetical protein
MSDKEIKFDSDVCHYTHIHESISSSNYQKIEYVKGCKDGKACIQVSFSTSEYEIYKCQEVNEIQLLKPNDKCDYSDECDSGLQCLNKVCTIDVSSTSHYPYYKGGYYFCPNDYVPGSTSSTGSMQCKKNQNFLTHQNVMFMIQQKVKIIFMLLDSKKYVEKLQLKPEMILYK